MNSCSLMEDLETSRSHATILVVDDEPSVRALAGFILRRRGYSVLEASNGREALDVVERHVDPIDLLVSDVQMPVMGGRELAEALAEVSPSTKVLLLSGFSRDNLLYEGMLNDRFSFLSKPFTATELEFRVRQLLG
jgi:two-component system, cell cycle sensor histidine kinase and response regulator CckA